MILQSALYDFLNQLKPEIAAAAQNVYDDWTDSMDASGGICDSVAEAIGHVLSQNGIDYVLGGQDGDDHAFLIAYDDEFAFEVDIPPDVYETGSGYSWIRIPDVEMTEDNVVVNSIDRSLLDHGLLSDY